jgi:hypothetical protein
VGGEFTVLSRFGGAGGVDKSLANGSTDHRTDSAASRALSSI